ncbi:MAG: pyridoxamine 5'-phosphate oxidase family protein [Actinobacteria bacterium]|nr:pyridoxamine 5'-phosphate oxidase family protein [Actinomycetota bacterium]
MTIPDQQAPIDRSPTILPVNHRLDGWRIVFRTTLGSKLTLATMGRPFAFEVDGYDAATRTGWSVLARGTAEAVWSRDAGARLEELDLQPWADVVDRDRWIAVHPDEITGRRIVPRPWEVPT